MKQLLKRLYCAVPAVITLGFDRVLALATKSQDGLVRERLLDTILSQERSVTHQGVTIRCACPNRMTVFRTVTLPEKEPETLEWIDRFADDGTFWDVGANVGMFSIYAALRHPGLQVLAFEPSVLNLELLARNLALNGVEGRVGLVPTALSDRSGMNRFQLGSSVHGGALSAFGVDYDQYGKPLQAKGLVYRTLGFSIDHLVRHMGVAVPNHIKIDVDGIEHIILQGGRETLRDRRIQSMLIEISEEFTEQKERSEALMLESGFVLREKRHGNLPETISGVSPSFNYIWERPV